MTGPFDPALGDLPPTLAVFPLTGVLLLPGGRLVANVVTIEGESALSEGLTTFGGDLTRIAISRAEPLGGLTGWRPQRAVTQFHAVKP